MNFKKPKKDIVNEVYHKVDRALRTTIHSHSPHGDRYMQGPNIDLLMHAVSVAIAEGVTTMMDNVYTDNEFEEDIGLREKK